MNILQRDAFGDGWWVLIELDDGRRHLLHVYDARGRMAPYPGDAVFEEQAAAMIAAEQPKTATLTVECQDGTLIGPGSVADVSLRLTATQATTANQRIDALVAYLVPLARVWPDLPPLQQRRVMRHSPVMQRIISLIVRAGEHLSDQEAD